MRLAICILFLIFSFSSQAHAAGQKKKSQFLSSLSTVVVKVKKEMQEEGKEVNIPTSLILAQGALEAGWEIECPGNNCFGLTPKKKHVKFHSIEEGTKYYILTLLSHKAYRELRESLRMGIENPIELAKALEDYSENPQYVQHIQSIIRTNNLEKYDW